MKTLRLSVVFVVLGLSMLLGLWALGSIGGPEVSEASRRMVAIVAIGGVASAVVLAVLGGRRAPGSPDSSDPPHNGPRF